MSAATAPDATVPFRKVVLGLDYTFTQRFMPGFALVAITCHPLFYVLDHLLFGMKDSLLLRLASVAINVPVLFFPRERPLATWQKAWWELTSGFMLPVTFVWLFVLNDLNTYWYASIIFAGLIYGVCSRFALVLFLYPAFLAVASWAALAGRGLGPGELQRMLETYAVSFLSAVITAIAGAALEHGLQRATLAESRLRTAQATLLEHEKLSALGRLVAQLSHEINNPINVIANNVPPLQEYAGAMVKMLGAMHAQPASAGGQSGGQSAELGAMWQDLEIDFVTQDAPKALALVESSVQRIQRIQADLGAFIRGEVATKTVGDLDAEIDATLEIFKRSLPAGVELSKELGGATSIAFHPGQVGQVVINLVQNALDAMKEKGKVIVRTEATPKAVRILVTDTGPGVPKAIRKQIFEPFFTTKEVGSGMGLGLAVCRQIVVENHAGRIELDAAYDAGARFVIELPKTS